mgnify:CR=1 FL=1
MYAAAQVGGTPRTHDGAQWEIRQVANACLEIAQSIWPIAVSSFRGQNE